MRAPEERVYFALDRSLDHALMGLVLAIGVQALPRDPHAMISYHYYLCRFTVSLPLCDSHHSYLFILVV